jgi:hypothetical protein
LAIREVDLAGKNTHILWKQTAKMHKLTPAESIHEALEEVNLYLSSDAIVSISTLL